jgi:ABC-type multidrug transport system fused ATPase/permease subunit
MDRMDGVVVMENGRVADRGTHAELLARHRRYADRYARMG